MNDPNYPRLLKLAERLSSRTRPGPESVFDPIGLRLQLPPERWDYHCTPLNSVTFASTGGDGVHFGFLEVQGCASSPVVMTIPLSDINNVIIGEGLFEFLCLGVGRGYFALEELAYNREAAAALLNGEVDEEMDSDEVRLLHLLRQEFRLEPWPEVEGRLHALEQKYAAAIQLPDFEEWRARNGV